MTTRDGERDVTPLQHFRAPDRMWQAFAAVCKRQDRSAADALIACMRRAIRRHGTEEEKRLLAEADAELAERRARKGGRPPRSPTAP